MEQFSHSESKVAIDLIYERIPVFWQVVEMGLQLQQFELDELEQLGIMMWEGVNTSKEIIARIKDLEMQLAIEFERHLRLGYNIDPKNLSNEECVDIFCSLTRIKEMERDAGESVAYQIGYRLNDLLAFSPAQLCLNLEARVRGEYRTRYLQKLGITPYCNITTLGGEFLGRFSLTQPEEQSLSNYGYSNTSVLELDSSEGLIKISHLGWHIEESANGKKVLVIDELQTGHDLTTEQKRRKQEYFDYAHRQLSDKSRIKESILPHHLGMLVRGLRQLQELDNDSEVIIVNRERNYYGECRNDMFVSKCLIELIPKLSTEELANIRQAFLNPQNSTNDEIAHELYSGFRQEMNNNIEDGQFFLLIDKLFQGRLSQEMDRVRIELVQNGHFRNVGLDQVSFIAISRIIKSTVRYYHTFQNYPSSDIDSQTGKSVLGMKCFKKMVHIGSARFDSNIGIISNVSNIEGLAGDLVVTQDFTADKEKYLKRCLWDELRREPYLVAKLSSFFGKISTALLKNDGILPYVYSAYSPLLGLVEKLLKEATTILPDMTDRSTSRFVDLLSRKSTYDPLNPGDVDYQRETVTYLFPGSIGEKVDERLIARNAPWISIDNIRGAVGLASCVGENGDLLFDPRQLKIPRAISYAELTGWLEPYKLILAGEMFKSAIRMRDLANNHRPQNMGVQGSCDTCPIRNCGRTDYRMATVLIPAMARYHKLADYAAFERVLGYV